jgi:hypothetical protein
VDCHWVPCVQAARFFLVGASGLEPLTFAVSRQRSTN